MNIHSQKVDLSPILYWETTDNWTIFRKSFWQRNSTSHNWFMTRKRRFHPTYIHVNNYIYTHIPTPHSKCSEIDDITLLITTTKNVEASTLKSHLNSLSCFQIAYSLWKSDMYFIMSCFLHQFFDFNTF